MTITFPSWVMPIFILVSFLQNAPLLASEPPSGSDSPQVVIPFDFESTFDQGRYGRMLGDMIWKKLERRGRFIIPEAMLDVRDWSAQSKVVLNPNTPLDKIQQIVREEFGGDIAIWGKVERLPNVDWDEYDLWINIADMSTEPPRMITQTKDRTKTVSEIPHRYVQQALDQLYGVTSSSSQEPQPDLSKDLWATGPHLVCGSFDSRQGWDSLPQHVTLEQDRSSGASGNHFIRFTIPENVAATTGVLYYSDFFPVQENAKYRFQCRWRTTGSAVKVFIKCYDELPTRYSKRDSSSRKTERREVYRSQQNLKGKSRAWNVHSEDFTPKHTQYTPRWGRVMLYGYWPEGVVDFDDVIVKQISPPPIDQTSKIRRPSLETRVRSDELE